LIFNGSYPNPERTRGRVEEEVGDDIARRQGVPTVAVDPSSGTAQATPERFPPPADRSLMVTVAVAPPGQTPPSTGKPAAMSALGARVVPRVLKKKVLSIKKSALYVSECFPLCIVGSYLSDNNS
jgi:hypothetical protein